jgi:hypothetical protein
MKKMISSSLLLVMILVYSNIYGMTDGNSAVVRSERQEHIDKKLKEFYELSKISDFALEEGCRPTAFDPKAYIGIVLKDVPENNIIESRVCDLDVDEWLSRPTTLPTKMACGINNMLLLGIPERYRNLTLLQNVFQQWLRRRGSMTYARRMVEVLLSYNFDLDELFHASRLSGLRISILHAAAMLDDASLIELLVKKRSARRKLTVDILDSEGLTPLQRIIVRNNVLFDTALQDLQIDDDQIQRKAEHLKAVKLLLGAGANPKVAFTIKTLCGKPQHILAEKYTRNAEIKNLLTGMQR